jgi:hypothetical protein
MNTESGFEDDKDGGEQYGKQQMIGTDDDGEVEASAECSDMRGKLYLSLDSFLLQLVTGFLYYAMSTL